MDIPISCCSPTFREELTHTFYLKPQDWVNIKPTDLMLSHENTQVQEEKKQINKKILVAGASVSTVALLATVAFVFMRRNNN